VHFGIGTAIAKDHEGVLKEILMSQPKVHPILIVAAAAVVLFSLLGAVALSGMVPQGNGSDPVLHSAPQSGGYGGDHG
jgi:hypothetical protein